MKLKKLTWNPQFSLFKGLKLNQALEKAYSCGLWVRIVIIVLIFILQTEFIE